MALYPKAVLKLLPENQVQGKITPTQVILHTAVDAPGSTSLYGYFGRSDVVLESHFFVQNDGTIEQYIDTEVRADANRYANKRPDGTGAVSIETEDDGNPMHNPWSDAQLKAIQDLISWLWRTHSGIARRLCRTSVDPGIGYHSMWGAPSDWTPIPGKDCPGPLRIGQFNNILAPWISTPPPVFKRKVRDHMVVVNESSGAALHVTGNVAVLIDNQADLADYKNAGIPVIPVRQSLFSRYEKLRVA